MGWIKEILGLGFFCSYLPSSFFLSLFILFWRWGITLPLSPSNYSSNTSITFCNVPLCNGYVNKFNFLTETHKSISSTALHFIFTYGEFSTCGESFFQPNSSTTLYFIFIFIKIVFLLFYLNFFSLFSFLAPLLNPPATTQPHPHPRLHHHAETKTQTTTPNPDRQPHNHTHGSITRLHHHIQPRSATPQPHPRLNHTHSSTTTPRQDCKPPHPT